MKVLAVISLSIGMANAMPVWAQEEVCPITFMTYMNGDTLFQLIDVVTNQCGDLRPVITVQSIGGEVDSMMYAYKELRRWGVDKVVGYSASSAAVLLLLTGDTRTMPRNGYLLIHEIGIETNPYADPATARETAELLEILSTDYAEIVSDRTGLTTERVRELMQARTYLNAEQALALGFVTEISE